MRKQLESEEVAKKLPDLTVYAVTTAEGQANTQFIVNTSNTHLDEVKQDLGQVFGKDLRHISRRRSAACI